jgi:hypothetical protein
MIFIIFYIIINQLLISRIIVWYIINLTIEWKIVKFKYTDIFAKQLNFNMIWIFFKSTLVTEFMILKLSKLFNFKYKKFSNLIWKYVHKRVCREGWKNNYKTVSFNFLKSFINKINRRIIDLFYVENLKNLFER